MPQLESLPSHSVEVRAHADADDGDVSPERDAEDAFTKMLANASPYPARPVRPLTRLVLRLGLWGAVVLGAVGGVVGLVSSGGGGSSDPEPVVTAEGVPAPVGGMAERVAEEWLLATDEDPSRIETLFVEAPELPGADDIADREVVRASAVAGEQVDDGYWAVTVAVDLIDGSGPDAEAAADGSEDGTAATEGTEAGEAEPGGDGEVAADAAVPELVTWHIEVGIVGEEDGALAALRTPAIVPAVVDVGDGWSSRAEDVVEPGRDDLETTTLQDFLRTVLTGEGDPTRYVAAGVEITPVDPPPFVELEITSLTVQEMSESVIRAQVFVDATTTTGTSQSSAYEIGAEWRDGRLEILELWGAASLSGRPVEPSEGDEG